MFGMPIAYKITSSFTNFVPLFSCAMIKMLTKDTWDHERCIIYTTDWCEIFRSVEHGILTIARQKLFRSGASVIAMCWGKFEVLNGSQIHPFSWAMRWFSVRTQSSKQNMAGEMALELLEGFDYTLWTSLSFVYFFLALTLSMLI